MMGMRHRLTQNFFLDEFTRSQVAARRGIEIRVRIGSQVYKSLLRLCEQVLQPLRTACGPVLVTSGYRPAPVNRLVGGAPGSFHISGLAADVVVSGLTPGGVVRWLIANRDRIPFDCAIVEFSRWTHIQIARTDDAPRRLILTATREVMPGGRAKTVYLHGLRETEEAA